MGLSTTLGSMASNGELDGVKVLLGVSGSISAYKAPMVLRELQRRGAEVRVAMSSSAIHFVGPSSFSGIAGDTPYLDLWGDVEGEPHVELAAWADVTVVAPATAHTLARMAHGIADDALSATLLCFEGPVVVAPAMHHRMWDHPATRSNVDTLRARGVEFAGPETGPLASGDVGIGRLSEPATIVDRVWANVLPAMGLGQPLQGTRVLITTGPTFEDFDPVRFWGNRSTGIMGMALATQARRFGAEVTVVHGPVQVPCPPGVVAVPVRSADEMLAAVQEHYDGVDVVIMAAAVADYRPETVSASKVKKGQDGFEIRMVRNPDILATLGQKRCGTRPVLVGFALESDQLEARGRAKLEQKGCDLVVCNAAPTVQADSTAGFGGGSFGATEVTATLVSKDSSTPLPPLDKPALATHILKRVVELLDAAESPK